MYQKNVVKKKHVDLLLIGDGGKKYSVLINDFNRFMYDNSLHSRKKYFCRYCLHGSIAEEILNVILKISLKLMVNKRLRCLRKVNMLTLKILKEK